MQREKKGSQKDTEQQECKQSPHVLHEKPFQCRLEDTERLCKPSKTPVSTNPTTEADEPRDFSQRRLFPCPGSSDVPVGPQLRTALLPAK